MKTTYDFYIGEITKDGKVRIIGPYFRIGNSYILTPVITRSALLIEFDELAAWRLHVEEMAEDQLELMSHVEADSGKRKSNAYFLTYEEVWDMVGDGLVKGYVPLEDLDTMAKNDNNPDMVEDLNVRTAEMIAEMDAETRKGYGHVAYVDAQSADYICSRLFFAAYPEIWNRTEDSIVFIAIES